MTGTLMSNDLESEPSDNSIGQMESLAVTGDNKWTNHDSYSQCGQSHH